MDIKKRINDILAHEAASISAVTVDDSYEKAVQALHACNGKVLTTGIGKAGIVAQKMAATLCSTTTPASFLHPAEAAHGDLGLAATNDVMIAYSTSGKSQEVLETIELGRHLGIETVIGITSHPDSTLRDLSDIVLDMGPIQEPCPIGLTPTSSIVVMLAISDAIALALMETKGVTRHEYGLRHHGGYLGKQARTDNIVD